MEVGDQRYAVSYLSWDRAKALIVKGGGDPETDSIWDFCEETDIEVYRSFPTRGAAFKWARRNADRDIFSMPRISEETYQEVTDDLANPAGHDWERTGYWEVDGDDVREMQV